MLNNNIPTIPFKKTPPILTCPDSSNNLGKNPKRKRLNSGRDIIKDIINTKIGNLIVRISLSFNVSPLRLIPI